ncbi:LysR substrate-binding domain-containing protein [Parendozoicomonas haliclonae]|uniref:HTH-type transcriptional regulator YjiE n=2 Tax=Parendozoicomonas haliclonae TaxID=1960125 RepID=A0A1X7AM41_9GAMM|nr:HTH-type transcriptional regulator YjiE [Parendozoicomonas haliclonae]
MLSLDFKWLEDFLYLKELGSFSAASKARHVTQSAFSRRIQALELWVGVPLFDRTSYPVKLTADGRKFVPYVEKMLTLVKETSDDFALSSLQTDHSIRVVCLHSFALNLIPKLFQVIKNKFNELNFSLTPSVLGVENHFNSILDGTSDIIFVYDMPGMRPAFVHEDKFEKIVVCESRIIPVVSKALSSSLVERDHLPYLAYAKHTFLHQPVNDVIARNELNLEQVFETTLSESLVKMAQLGAGVAWIPSHDMEEELARGDLVRLYPEKTDLEIPVDIVCYRSKASKRQAVNDFWRGLQTVLCE